jgi:hypothetical protein
MLTEQLNIGAQEPRVLNIYRNYLFTTQENHGSRFDCYEALQQTVIVLHRPNYFP